MSVVMAPLWAVDLVLVLAPVAMAIAVAARRVRRGEPVEAMVVSGNPRKGGGGGRWRGGGIELWLHIICIPSLALVHARIVCIISIF